MQSRWIPDAHMEAIMERLTPVDRALIGIMRTSGFRVDDVLSSRRWQWSKDVVTLRERKTGNVRSVAITQSLREYVDLYSRLTRYKSASLLCYLVPSRRGRPTDTGKLHRTTIWRHFMKAVKAAGLEGHGYSIHSLRKCYAVDLLRATGSLEHVQADLGHKYISTTLIYVKDALRLSE